MIKNGTRLQSQVCDTQVIVVRTSDSLDDLRAGGAPMVPRRREGCRRNAGPGVLGRHRNGQTLRRRDRCRSTGDQGRCRIPVRRDYRADIEGSQAATGQRLTTWPHEA